MSAESRTKPAKPAAASDIYTVLVIAAFFAVFAIIVFVAAKMLQPVWLFIFNSINKNSLLTFLPASYKYCLIGRKGI